MTPCVCLHIRTTKRDKSVVTAGNLAVEYNPVMVWLIHTSERTLN